MLFQIICVLHGEKLRVESSDAAIKANPGLSEKGKIDMHLLAPRLKELGPYDRIFASRLDRANASASAICLANDWDWETLRLLGQHADRQDNVTVAYPGYETESYPEWYAMAQNLVKYLDVYYQRFETYDEPRTRDEYVPKMKSLAFTHRAIVACLIALTRDITDLEAIRVFARGDEIKQRSIYIFERDTVANTFRCL